MSAALFIGADEAIDEIMGEAFDVTMSASPSPKFPTRSGTAAEWREFCADLFKTNNEEEKPVIREAMKMVLTHKAELTVHVDALCFGTSDMGTGKVTSHATIAAPNAWRQIVGLAKAHGATIVYL